MSFITPTERKHWSTRLLMAAMYGVLITGALTMVYPFLLMLSGSIKDRVDFDQFEVIPSYFHDEVILFRKFERARYNANMWRWQIAAKSDLEIMEEIPLPASTHLQAAADFAQFLREADLPEGYLALGQSAEGGVQPRNERKFRTMLYREFGGDLSHLNHAMSTTLKNWGEVTVVQEHLLGRGNTFGDSPLAIYLRTKFLPTVPPHEFWPVHVEGVYFDRLRSNHGRDIANLNRAWKTSYVRFQDVPLPRTYPAGEPHAAGWEQFVRKQIHEAFLRLKPGSGRPEKCPADPAARREWVAFIETGDCLPYIEIDSVEFRFRDWLTGKYGGNHESMALDLPGYDLHLMRQHRNEVLWEFATRNYRYAWDFLAVRGRAFWNTIIYCGGNVLLHLIVNPLAAYALSRYRLRWSHLILLFCMLTMAIPGEVGGIPRFLLIRELGLLNTFWALILPGAAHGFSIFILKGFFDGLPQDLYEAGLIEGASERWMFWNVTLALTKPILAVTALGAFTSAYGSFMFALIICPDEKMWTISVWLYQFQQVTSESVGFAALVLASLPVLVVFLLAQRVILRGIVLPVEK